MSLRLEIVSSHKRDLGAKAFRTFGQDGGTIGRAIESDWALPDTNRFLSGRHASIDFRSGSYYIVDMSKNGVFVNGSHEPVGKGKPQRLFSGDLIRIGEYEMRVLIENVDDTRESLMGDCHIDPVDAKQRVESPEPTTYDLLEPHVITGVGIEMQLEEDDEEALDPALDFTSDLRLESDPDSDSRPDSAVSLGSDLHFDVGLATASDEDSTPTAAITSITERRAMFTSLDAFFRGAGVDAPSLSPKQAERLLTRLGKITREFISGTIDCLHVRNLQKAQLKQGNTTIQPRDNNPLKFSANFQEGFQRLLFEESEGNLKAADAVRDAMADLAAHERTLMLALREALDEYLDRFDPEVIERSVGSSRMGALMSAANKHRFWDVYKDIFAILGDRPADELPEPFKEELARAYERNRAAGELRDVSAADLKAG